MPEQIYGAVMHTTETKSGRAATGERVVEVGFLSYYGVRYTQVMTLRCAEELRQQLTDALRKSNTVGGAAV